MTCEQNGPLPRISCNTAIADAGDRAIASVPASDPTATACHVLSPRNIAMLVGPRRRTTERSTKRNESVEMASVITSVGLGFLRSSDARSSAPAATPMTARQTTSRDVSIDARRSVATPATCGPHAMPAKMCPVMRGSRTRCTSDPAAQDATRTSANLARRIAGSSSFIARREDDRRPRARGGGARRTSRTPSRTARS